MIEVPQYPFFYLFLVRYVNHRQVPTTKSCSQISTPIPVKFFVSSQARSFLVLFLTGLLSLIYNLLLIVSTFTYTSISLYIYIYIYLYIFLSLIKGVRGLSVNCQVTAIKTTINNAYEHRHFFFRQINVEVNTLLCLSRYCIFVFITLLYFRVILCFRLFSRHLIFNLSILCQ